ncbi:MAG: hypothetical protein D6712_15220 [Chloroflexi bacterium]|nr:MAG: hypothetical protein D6712_15220 [Chloroflexota bacterium]
MPDYDIDWLRACNRWIEAAGNTLEAYIMVPRMIDQLDVDFYNAIQWLRRNYDIARRLKNTDLSFGGRARNE